MMFWVSVHRYLLILHFHLYARAKYRLFFHYLPLISTIIYLMIFYIVVIFIYPCENQFDFNQPVCGFPCYTNYTSISGYDVIAHTLIPSCIAIFLDISLTIRVISRKRVGLQQSQAQWCQHRKMIRQLLLLESLYSICQVPFDAIIFLQLFITLPDSIVYIEIIYSNYLFWLLTLLLPFASIGCMPEVINKIKNTIKWTRQNAAVVPMAAGHLRNGT